MICFVGCDSAAKQQRDNDAHRAAMTKQLTQQGEAVQTQQPVEKTTQRQNDGVNDPPEG